MYQSLSITSSFSASSRLTFSSLVSSLSSSPNPSLSLPCSVSLSKPLSRSLSPRVRHLLIKQLCRASGNTHRPHWLRWRQYGRSKLNGSPDTIVAASGHAVAYWHFNAVSSHFLWWFWVPTSSSWPPHHNGNLHLWRKYPNIGMLFCAKYQNFVSRSEPNRALFWCNDLSLLIVVKNTFQWYIICLCLNLFAKNHIFWD